MPAAAWSTPWGSWGSTRSRRSSGCSSWACWRSSRTPSSARSTISPRRWTRGRPGSRCASTRRSRARSARSRPEGRAAAAAGPVGQVRESDGLEPILRLGALWQRVGAEPSGRPSRGRSTSATASGSRRTRSWPGRSPTRSRRLPDLAAFWLAWRAASGWSSRTRRPAAHGRLARVLGRQRGPPAADDRHRLAVAAGLARAAGALRPTAARPTSRPCPTCARPCSCGWPRSARRSGSPSTTWPATSRRDGPAWDRLIARRRAGPATPIGRDGAAPGIAAARRGRRRAAGAAGARAAARGAAAGGDPAGRGLSARPGPRRRGAGDRAAGGAAHRRWGATSWRPGRRRRPGRRSSSSCSSSRTSR